MDTRVKAQTMSDDKLKDQKCFSNSQPVTSAYVHFPQPHIHLTFTSSSVLFSAFATDSMFRIHLALIQTQTGEPKTAWSHLMQHLYNGLLAQWTVPCFAQDWTRLHAQEWTCPHGQHAGLWSVKGQRRQTKCKHYASIAGGTIKMRCQKLENVWNLENYYLVCSWVFVSCSAFPAACLHHRCTNICYNFSDMNVEPKLFFCDGYKSQNTCMLPINWTMCLDLQNQQDRSGGSYPAWRNGIFLCSTASCRHWSSSSGERQEALDTLCIAWTRQHQ